MVLVTRADLNLTKGKLAHSVDMQYQSAYSRQAQG